MQHLRQGTTRSDENHVRVRKLKDGSLTGLLVQALEGKDVKDLLGCSASEVSRHLHAGMTRLRRLLADWSDAVNR